MASTTREQFEQLPSYLQTPSMNRHLGICARRGVELVDPHGSVYQCVECGRAWSVMIQGHPKPPLRRGWWHCLNGCNTSERE